MIDNCPDRWPPRLLHHCHCLVDLRQHNTQGVASSLNIKSCLAASPARKTAKTPLAPSVVSTARSGCPVPEQNSTYKILRTAPYQLSGSILAWHFTVFTVWSPCIDNLAEPQLGTETNLSGSTGSFQQDPHRLRPTSCINPLTVSMLLISSQWYWVHA